MFLKTGMWIAFASLYLVMVGYTYGTSYPDNLDFYIRQQDTFGRTEKADMSSSIEAIFWPIYWSCHLGYKLSQGE